MIILGGNHNVDFVSTYPFFCNSALNSDCPHPPQGAYPVSKGDIIIGNDVWIGYGATILSGVTIANGSVIGAGSVVTKSTRPYSVSAGVPCKEIRKRFKPEYIRQLKEAKWWDLPDEMIRRLSKELTSCNIELFIEKLNTINILTTF